MPICSSISPTTRVAHARLSTGGALALSGRASSVERGSLAFIFLLFPVLLFSLSLWLLSALDSLRDPSLFQILFQTILLGNGENVVGENIQAQSGGVVENDRGEKHRHHIGHYSGLRPIHHLRLKLLCDNHRDTQKKRQNIGRVLVSEVDPDRRDKRLAVDFV